MPPRVPVSMVKPTLLERVLAEANPNADITNSTPPRIRIQ